MSDRFGTSRRHVGPCASNAPAISGRAAFFEPLTLIFPRNRGPPSIIKESMNSLRACTPPHHDRGRIFAERDQAQVIIGQPNEARLKIKGQVEPTPPSASAQGT